MENQKKKKEVKKKNSNTGLIVVIVILVVLLLVSVIAGAYYINILSRQVKDMENELEELKFEKDVLENKADDLIEETKEKTDIKDDEDIDMDIKGEDDKDSSTLKNDLDKYMNDPDYDYVVLEGVGKTFFFLPPKNWESTYEKLDNLARNYSISSSVYNSDNVLHIEVQNNPVNSNDVLEVFYSKFDDNLKEKVKNNEIKGTMLKSYGTVSLNSGNTVKSISSTLAAGELDIEYLWVEGDQIVRLMLLCIEEDVDKMEKVADEIAKSVIIINEIK